MIARTLLLPVLLALLLMAPVTAIAALLDRVGTFA
jgi:hypothetical protein